MNRFDEGGYEADGYRDTLAPKHHVRKTSGTWVETGYQGSGEGYFVSRTRTIAKAMLERALGKNTPWPVDHIEALRQADAEKTKLAAA